MLGFSKDELCNKLLGGITLLRVIPGVTWTQPIYMCVLFFGFNYIYIYIYMSWIQVTPGVTLSNVTSPNNLL